MRITRSGGTKNDGSRRIHGYDKKTMYEIDDISVFNFIFRGTRRIVLGGNRVKKVDGTDRRPSSFPVPLLEIKFRYSVVFQRNS